MASMQDQGFYCIPEEKMPEPNRTVYCGLCMAAAIVGAAGAAWQVHQWRPFCQDHRLRRKPSPNPMVIISRAVADLLACLSLLVRSVAMLSTLPPAPLDDNTGFFPLNNNTAAIATGTAIEAVNQYFYGVSFLWTVVYATDIYLQLTYVDQPEIAYHMLCWALPALTTAGSVITVSTDFTMCASGTNLILRHVFYYLLLIVAMVGAPVMSFQCNKLIARRMRESGMVNHHTRGIMSTLRKKFLAATGTFILCWFPNVVDGVVQISSVAADIPPASLAHFFPLWALEAILNPLQGLFNCFMYGRHMLFRRIAKSEGKIHQADDIRENMPILYRHSQDLFASE